jgi:nitroreductase
MELQEAIQNRRSIRRFLAKPVSDDIIEELVTRALWAPSWGNTQSWGIVVATGDRLEQFKRENKRAMLAGKHSVPEIPMPQAWPDANLMRYKKLGKSVFEALGIAREDKEAKQRHFAQMFALFDAPAVVLLTVDREITIEYAMLDAGLFMQTFCLLAHDRGLGTCILAATVMYPEITHKILSIPDNKCLIIGAALGWPDTAAAVNRFERDRGSVEEFVQWVK